MIRWGTTWCRTPTQLCSFIKYKQCGHSPILAEDPRTLDAVTHKRALDAVKNILNKGNRREELLSVCPNFSTHSVESYHSVATKYTSKNKFYDKPGYEFRTKLSVLHWNNLKMDEENGLRPVVREVRMWCKTKKAYITKKRKAPPCHKWRKDLMELLYSTPEDDEYSMDLESVSDVEDPENIYAEDIDEEEVRIRAEVERMLYEF
ncbi:unnamed protein product [Caenorhabditis brenneri]